MTEAVFQRLKERSSKPRMMPLTEYLEGCSTNHGYYASAPERLLKAMGEPKMVNTIDHPRMGRLFQNRKLRQFPAFADFYGIEDSVEMLYNTLKSASQGLEESKQIIYFLGPVGSAKSSLAERVKSMMEQEYIYVLAVPKKDDKGREIAKEFTYSPLYESPLGLFPETDAVELEETYGIPRRYFDGICSPWAVKRLREFEGDVTKFWVAEMRPSKLQQIGIAKTEPGDDNNQDISALVGKVDVRMLEDFAVNDPDAYSYSGALCKTSQGLMEFVEMFKAPIKTLHPLLTATQEHNFMGTEAIGAMPFRGIILAHSNESEWDKFSKDTKNEAFLDRVKVIKVRYNLRLTDEQNIYRKLLSGSALGDMTIAPLTLELLGRVVIASRLTKTNKCKPAEKVLIYDGRDLRDELPAAPTLYDLQEEAGTTEGMVGISTRTAFKMLSRASNMGEEIGLDPVELLQVMKAELKDLGSDYADSIKFADEQAKLWLVKKLGDMIRESLLEDHEKFAQTRFERYVEQAGVWLNPEVGAYSDPDTGIIMDKVEIAKKLEEIEGSSKIGNAKDYRNDIVTWVMRQRLATGKFPKWDEYQPMKNVIHAIVTKQTQDLLPLIIFGPKRDAESDEKHASFMTRMHSRGFTEQQALRVVTWYQQMSTTS